MARAAQMDDALEAGLSHVDLSVLAEARMQWHRRNEVGETYQIDVPLVGLHPVGWHRLDEVLARPEALLFDEVFVRALRHERGVRVMRRGRGQDAD